MGRRARLSLVGATESAPELIKRFRDKTIWAIPPAAQALGELKAKEQLPAILQFLQDKIERVRAGAIEAIGEIGVKSHMFSTMLESSIRKYQNRAIQAAQVIEELIGLAQQMREKAAKGEELGLSEDEVAFYDALEVNDSAVKVLGDATLKTIARELVDTVRRNTTIDWTVRENIRANLRVLVKRILRKYGYPPDKQEKAALTVLEQAETLSASHAGGIRALGGSDRQVSWLGRWPRGP
jgi:HEAT repeat protein